MIKDLLFNHLVTKSFSLIRNENTLFLMYNFRLKMKDVRGPEPYTLSSINNELDTKVYLTKYLTYIYI